MWMEPGERTRWAGRWAFSPQPRMWLIWTPSSPCWKTGLLGSNRHQLDAHLPIHLQDWFGPGYNWLLETLSPATHVKRFSPLPNIMWQFSSIPLSPTNRSSWGSAFHTETSQLIFLLQESQADSLRPKLSLPVPYHPPISVLLGCFIVSHQIGIFNVKTAFPSQLSQNNKIDCDYYYY